MDTDGSFLSLPSCPLNPSLHWPPFTCPALFHSNSPIIHLACVNSLEYTQGCSCLRRVPLLFSVASIKCGSSPELLMSSHTFSVEPPWPPPLKLHLLMAPISELPLASLHTEAFIFMYIVYTFIFCLLKMLTGVKANQSRDFVGYLCLCQVHKLIKNYLYEKYYWWAGRLLERCLGS